MKEVIRSTCFNAFLYLGFCKKNWNMVVKLNLHKDHTLKSGTEYLTKLQMKFWSLVTAQPMWQPTNQWVMLYKIHMSYSWGFWLPFRIMAPSEGCSSALHLHTPWGFLPCTFLVCMLTFAQNGKMQEHVPLFLPGAFCCMAQNSRRDCLADRDYASGWFKLPIRGGARLVTCDPFAIYLCR